MAYLYNEGSEPTAWVVGFSSGAGSQSKESDHFHFYMAADNTTNRTYVTNVTIDLTNIDEIKVSWEAPAVDPPYGAVLSAGTNKNTRARDDEAMLRITRQSWSRRTDTLDVSGLSGSHYIKVAIEGAQFDGLGPSQLDIYQVWTISAGNSYWYYDMLKRRN